MALINEYHPVREDRSRIIISFGLEPMDDGKHATWHEVYFYKKQNPRPSMEEIRQAITSAVNDEVTRRIVEGFEWKGHAVWLSTENQLNYKSATDLAVQTEGENLPVTFKFGSDDAPDYYTFEEVEELKEFWQEAALHISTSLSFGWRLKDGVDYSEYSAIELPSNGQRARENEPGQDGE